jgi:hypothetical protein
VDGTGEHHLKLARLRRPKTACFLSNVDCKPKKNVAILWVMDPTKGRLCKGKGRKLKT